MTVHRLAAKPGLKRETSPFTCSFQLYAQRLGGLSDRLLVALLLVVDLAVATLLMSMGMMMLPPVMISLLFKVLIFLLADGWNLVVVNLPAASG